MKTAISIPDPLFRAAEEFAHSHGLSRSELFARAVGEYLQAHRRERITEQLNRVYGDEERASMEPELEEMQRRSVGWDDERW